VQGDGLVLFFTGLAPTVLMSVGEPLAIVKVLSDAGAAGELPAQVYLSIREHHLPVIDRFYDSSLDRRSMVRMVLRRDGHLLQNKQTTPQRLGVADAGRLRRLYAHGGPFTPDAFAPYQLAGGIFFGIGDETGELVAAGGTHIVNLAENVAAIGNIYTRPDRRGQGYAKAITAAIVDALRAEGVGTIVLNVDQRNDAARALYRTLGFEEYCAFWEGVAERRNV
jgi:ribosomal protein S18 acetylase RimI-like enzyme